MGKYENLTTDIENEDITEDLAEEPLPLTDEE